MDERIILLIVMFVASNVVRGDGGADNKIHEFNDAVFRQQLSDALQYGERHGLKQRPARASLHEDMMRKLTGMLL
jgi:hypothetical protein